VAGSKSLVHTLLDHVLIDELQLMVFPVTIGSGLRVFPETTKEDLVEDDRIPGLPVRRAGGHVSTCSSVNLLERQPA